MDNENQMRDDIYRQLKEQYIKDPTSISDGAKAILAVVSTTKYMDDYDKKGDMFADMARRLEAAEKIMDALESGELKTEHKQGANDPTNIILDLIPIGMVEFAEGYTHLDDMVSRMWNVLDRDSQFCLNEYEVERGLPVTPPPSDRYKLDDGEAIECQTIEELLGDEG